MMEFEDSPVYKYGYAIPYVEPVKRVRYNGKHLPSFMVDQGYEAIAWKEFLRINKISPFDLESGQEVILPPLSEESSFSIHPDA